MLFTIQVLAAICLDLVVGDPKALPHPVEGIGRLCEIYEQRARKVLRNPGLAGSMAAVGVLSSTLLVIGTFLMLLHRLAPVLEMVAAVWLLATSLACRSLYEHSMDVYHALTSGESLEHARIEIGKIVGRDTAALDQQGICRAAVETVAENLVDGILAPLFFALLFSLLPHGEVLAPLSLAVLGAYCYKTINTMDSMFGYKNERYRHFGTLAARVDDVANFVPARLSGPLLVAAGRLLGLDTRGGWRIFLRDRLRHASPNSGHPEAAVAGLLGIQLGGSSSYFGKVVEKPTMGDGARLLVPEDIKIVNRLMLLASGMFAAGLLLIRYLLDGGW